MISSARRGLHESLFRLCKIQAPQAIPSQRTTSLIPTPAACLHTHCLPCQPASLMAARYFAAASAEQYSPEGQMSAVTFHGPRSVKVSKKAKPRLETPGDVIVKVTMSSICGSDMHPYAGRGVALDHGITFGHEYTGVIVAVGDDIQTLKIGDRVASAFSTSCGQCFYCKHALTCRCEKGGRFGWIVDGQGIEGSQAEFVRVPMADSTLIPTPDNVTDKEALLVGDVLPTGWFCASRGEVDRMTQEFPDDATSAAVIGCGPVGLMAILAAQAQGAQKVFALDTVQERLDLAKEFGAVPVHGGDREDALKVIKEGTEGRGVDCALEAVGAQPTIKLAFDLIRMGGVISSVGLHTDSEFKAFTPAEGYNKNVTYKNGRCPARHYMDELMSLVGKKYWGDPFPGNKIFSHEVSLHDEKAVQGAYTKFEKKLENCTKVLIVP
ncbi:TPA: hypothetical protein ACH3X2_009225 [Trebouxia sp. C0005]